MKYLFHQEKLLVTKWNFRWDCKAQGDEIKLLQKIFGSKINSSALSIDDFEDKNLYFLVAKILTFVNEKFRWGKYLVTKFLFHQGKYWATKQDFCQDTFSDGSRATNKARKNFRWGMFLQTKFGLSVTKYFVAKSQFSCSDMRITSICLIEINLLEH